MKIQAKWLSLILLLTNRIYLKKQNLLQQTSIKALVNIIALIFLEIILAIISLPLYLGMKPAQTKAYLEEKGGYKKITFDYNLRRLLTLTGVGVVFLIWTIKLLIIIFFPNVYGPLNLYTVSNLQPVDIMQQEQITSEIEIQTAKIDTAMKRPEITGAEKVASGEFDFYGTGQPNSTIVLFISDKQTLIYSDQVNESGQWRIKHLQKDFRLSEGNHSLLVFGYNEQMGTRSETSSEQFFRIQTTALENLVNNFDIFINSTLIVILAMGVFLTFLTI